MKTFNRYFQILLMIFFITFNTNLSAQVSNYNELPSGLSSKNFSVSNDSKSLIIKAEKNYWLPAVEIIGLNFGVWAFSRYLTSQGWSAISWESIKNNFNTGFAWDLDGYLMNQFWHPYHGSNYFNLARSNGLTFWESAPYAFGGSLMWEYFMENEPPSYNDIVNTPVTGIILGEISFKVSNLIIDESKSGFERLLRELTSTLIDPMQGINRLLRGDMWRNGVQSPERNFNLTFASGVHNIFYSAKFNNSKTYGTVRADLEYGNLLNVSEHNNPFDYFTVKTEINLTKDDNIVGIFASGVLWDVNHNLFQSSDNIFGLYKEVDIHINTVYKLSATSVTGQLFNTIPFTKTISFQNYIGISAILMGATNSIYSSEYGKDYNIGPGASAKVGLKLNFQDNLKLYSNYKRYWIHTLSGADSEELVGLLNIGVNIPLHSNTYIGLDYLLYERFGEYNLFPDTNDSNSALRFYIGIAI